MKALKEIDSSTHRRPVGLTSHPPSSALGLDDDNITPDSARRALQELSRSTPLIVIFDEFDRVQHAGATVLMADTIKSLSDYSVPATILIIGVADSVDGLIKEHQSIERALIQVHMPRMSDDEIRDIIRNGLTRLTMEIDDAAGEELVRFSQGVPYIAHLLALHSCRSALASGSKFVSGESVERGMNRSLAVATIDQSLVSRSDERPSDRKPLQGGLACLRARRSRRSSLFHTGGSQRALEPDRQPEF